MKSRNELRLVFGVWACIIGNWSYAKSTWIGKRSIKYNDSSTATHRTMSQILEKRSIQLFFWRTLSRNVYNANYKLAKAYLISSQIIFSAMFPVSAICEPVNESYCFVVLRCRLWNLIVRLSSSSPTCPGRKRPPTSTEIPEYCAVYCIDVQTKWDLWTCGQRAQKAHRSLQTGKFATEPEAAKIPYMEEHRKSYR